MGEPEGNVETDTMKNIGNADYLSIFKDNGMYGIAGAVIVAIVIPVLLSIVLRGKKKVFKQRGVPVQVSGEVGLAMRNARSLKLVEVPWGGATTMAALFEQSCKKHAQGKFLGTRKVIAKDTVTASDGRKFEKLHMGEYQWKTYVQVFDRAFHFASGLIKLGHDPDTRAAIFADTQPKWLIAFQGVMMTHCNILATAAAVMTVVPAIGSKDIYMAYWPLAHVFEFAAETVMLTAGCAIGYGSALTLTDTSNKIKKGT